MWLPSKFFWVPQNSNLNISLAVEVSSMFFFLVFLRVVWGWMWLPSKFFWVPQNSNLNISLAVKVNSMFSTGSLGVDVVPFQILLGPSKLQLKNSPRE